MVHIRNSRPQNDSYARLMGCYLSLILLVVAGHLHQVEGFAAAVVTKARIPQDLPEIRTCRATAFDNKPMDKLLESQQSFVNATSVVQGRTECFVVRNSDDNTICGTADIKFQPSSQSVTISNVFVTPESRGQGLAKLMLEAIEEEALARGANRLTLQVYTNNVPAYTLYQRSSFTTNGVHDGLAKLSKFTGFPLFVDMEKSLN